MLALSSTHCKREFQDPAGVLIDKERKIEKKQKRKIRCEREREREKREKKKDRNTGRRKKVDNSSGHVHPESSLIKKERKKKRERKTKEYNERETKLTTRLDTFSRSPH